MGEGARILVIDDEEGIRRVLAEVLEIEGYSVDTAGTGMEGIKKSTTNSYNLALIDVRLPDMEGTDLLTAMNETTPRMIKIILTGFPSLDNTIDSVNRGADAFIVKPVNVDTLLKTIKEHLEKQEKSMRFDEKNFADFVKSRFKEWEDNKSPRVSI
jgi:DNA-binding NtrC family response regulator